MPDPTAADRADDATAQLLALACGCAVAAVTALSQELDRLPEPVPAPRSGSVDVPAPRRGGRSGRSRRVTGLLPVAVAWVGCWYRLRRRRLAWRRRVPSGGYRRIHMPGPRAQ